MPVTQVVAPTATLSRHTGSTASQILEYNKADVIHADRQTSASPQRSKTRAVTSVADLAGEYVMTFTTLVTVGSDGGNGVTVSQVEGTDSIEIANFWESGITVKAKVDLTAMTISIPNQMVGTHATYGDYDIACYDTQTDSVARDTEIGGTISTDGVISITSAWGVFLTSEAYSGGYFGMYTGATIEPANATMSQDVRSSSTGLTTTTTYNVVVEQTGINVVAVKNFANFGQTIEIILASDSTATIASQLAKDDQTYGDWYTYAVTYADDWSSLSIASTTITCNKATDSHTISWGNWNLINSSYFYDYYTSGSITATADITYPDVTLTTLEGSGTESSPYLIKSLADLVTLADLVNNADLGSDDFVKVYLNEYFRLENDIDMTGYRFTPIGQDYYHRFGGIFDGNGKTLTGLNVNTGNSGYAGLFGRGDTVSVIKNLTLVDPAVYTTEYFAGAVVAYTHGAIENCHVSGATISNTGYTGAGGLTAYAATVSGCSVTNSQITGTGGFTGGMAGQVNSTISDCHVSNTSIYGGGSGTAYPNGGVAGSLNGATATGCYFTGSIHSTTVDNQRVGGIAGVCSGGSIEKCFSSATIVASGSTAQVGGIAGYLGGTISNCYSNSTVAGAETPYVGGLSGYVYTYTDSNGSTCQSSLSGSYSACYLEISLDTYDTETEMREVTGYVASDISPTVENVYFDKQITNFGSAQAGVTTAELTSASGLTGLDATVWTLAEGYYPRLAGMDQTEAALFSASAVYSASPSSISGFTKNAKLNLLGTTEAYFEVDGSLVKEGNYATIDGDSIKLKTAFGTDTLWFTNSTAGNRYYALGVSPVGYDGSGTEADPYLLRTKADLVSLAEITTNAKYLFHDTYFKMACDIDLECDTAFVGLCTDETDSNNQFSGTFDGGGYAIHRMKLPSAVGWSIAPADDADGLGTVSSKLSKSTKGFIGRLASCGTVKNLTIASDCDLNEFYAYSGALVGYNNGLIDSCVNYSAITAYSTYTGGMTGYNNGTITNCLNAGSILSGYSTVAGIAGVNKGLVANCQNVGDISTQILTRSRTQSQLIGVGGIVSSLTAGRIENCVNAGKLYGYDRVGGIAAYVSSASSSTTYHNDIVNCLNYGAVLSVSDSYTGNIGGYSVTSKSLGDISGNYYDAQITTLGTSGNLTYEGVTAATTSDLTSGTALDGLSTSIWDFTAGSYPVMKAFADEDAVKVARNIIAKLADGETAANMRSAAELSTANDCEWTLKVGTDFTITNGKLVPPSLVTDVVTDTLVATTSLIVKPIIVKTLPGVPLSGSGTADSPYLINTTTDWNNLAIYIASTESPMTDAYIKVVNDLDFTGDSILPLAYDRATAFDADLDGNGKTIKGINHTADAQYFGGIVVVTGENANIHDMTVEGDISAAYMYVGGVVGQLYGAIDNVTSKVNITTTKNYSGGAIGASYSGSQATNSASCGTITSSGTYASGFVAYAYLGSKFDNCVNEGNVTSSGTYASGFVGRSEATNVFTDCGNRGTVTYTGTSATSYLSGFAAYCYPDTLIRCFNEGKLVSDGTAAGGVSGLVGYAYANSTYSTTHYLEDCYNTADITSCYNNAGLILTQTSSYTKVYMDGCYNTGNITSNYSSTKSITYTAGLACYYSAASTYINCWNSGTITSVTPLYAGGLFAYYRGSFSSGNSSTTSNCRNTGDVVAGGGYGGGIVAYCYDYTTIDSCSNTGNISGGCYLGGIVGYLYGDNTSITASYNAGNVTSNSYYAGGLIGYDPTGATINNCFNVGDVATTGTDASAGYGIGGIAGCTAAKITRVYNTGTVTGADFVGGIVGYPVKGSVTIANAYSSGHISTPDSVGGNIVGVATDNTTYWSSGNSLSKTYYLAANAAPLTDDSSSSLSYTELATLSIGNKWTAGDDYTYPRLNALATVDYAIAHAAAVIPADGDTYASITQDFSVGAPDGVVWTASPAVVEVSGNTATFTEAYTGTLVMTATCGDAVATTELTCEVTNVGVADICDDNGRSITAERFYTTSGVEVAEPYGGMKTVYIVVRSYSDGTIETAKEVR